MHKTWNNIQGCKNDCNKRLATISIIELSLIALQFSLVFRFISDSVFLPYSEGFSLCTCSCTVGKNQVSFRDGKSIMNFN